MPAGVAAATLGRVLIQFVARTDEFDRNLARTSRGISQFALNLAKMGTAMVAAGATARVFFDPITRGFISATKEAAKFQTKMNEITTLMESEGVSASQEFGDSLRKVGADLGFTLEDLGNALRESVSSGLLEAANSGEAAAVALELLEKAGTLSRVSTEDLATSVDFLRKVLNGYGIELKTGAQAQEVLNGLISAGFETVDFATFEFGEMNAAIGKVIPTAARLGVSIEEVFGALAAMSRAGLNARESVVSLNRLLLAFTKPSGKATKVAEMLNKQLGLTGDEAIELSGAFLQRNGLIGAIEKLDHATRGNIDAVTQLLTRERALRGFAALVTNDMRNLKSAVAAVSHELSSPSGLTAELQLMMDTTAQMERTQAIWQQTMQGIGGSTLPEVNKGFVWLNEQLQKFNQNIQDAPGTVGLFATALGGLSLAGSALSRVLVTLGFLSFTVLAFRPLFRSVFITLPKAAASDMVRFSGTIGFVRTELDKLKGVMEAFRARGGLFAEIIGTRHLNRGAAIKDVLPATFQREVKITQAQLGGLTKTTRMLTRDVMKLKTATDGAALSFARANMRVKDFRGLTSAQVSKDLRNMHMQFTRISKSLAVLSTGRNSFFGVSKAMSHFGSTGQKAGRSLQAFSSQIPQLERKLQNLLRSLNQLEKQWDFLSAAKQAGRTRSIGRQIATLEKEFNRLGIAGASTNKLFTDMTTRLTQFGGSAKEAGGFVTKFATSVKSLSDVMGTRFTKELGMLNREMAALQSTMKNGNLVTAQMTRQMANIESRFAVLTKNTAQLTAKGFGPLANSIEQSGAAFAKFQKDISKSGGLIGAQVTKQAEQNFAGLAKGIRQTHSAITLNIRDMGIFQRMLLRMGVDVRDVTAAFSRGGAAIRQFFAGFRTVGGAFESIASIFKGLAPVIKTVGSAARALLRDFLAFEVVFFTFGELFKLAKEFAGLVGDIIALDKSYNQLGDTMDKLIDKYRLLGGEFDRTRKAEMELARHEARRAQSQIALIEGIQFASKALSNLPLVAGFASARILLLIGQAFASIGGLAEGLVTWIGRHMPWLGKDFQADFGIDEFRKTIQSDIDKLSQTFKDRVDEADDLFGADIFFEQRLEDLKATVKKYDDFVRDFPDEVAGQKVANLFAQFLPDVDPEDTEELKRINAEMDKLVGMGLTRTQAFQTFAAMGQDFEMASTAAQQLVQDVGNVNRNLNAMLEDAAQASGGFLEGVGLFSEDNPKLLHAVNMELQRLVPGIEQLKRADLKEALDIRDVTGARIELAAYAALINDELSEPLRLNLTSALGDTITDISQIQALEMENLKERSIAAGRATNETVTEDYAAATDDRVAIHERGETAKTEVTRREMETQQEHLRQHSDRLEQERESHTAGHKRSMEEVLIVARQLAEEEERLQRELHDAQQRHMQLLHDMHDPSITEEQKERVKEQIVNTKNEIRGLRADINNVKQAFSELANTGEVSQTKIQIGTKKMSDSFKLARGEMVRTDQQVKRTLENAINNLDKMTAGFTQTQQEVIAKFIRDMQDEGIDMIDKLGKLSEETVEEIHQSMLNDLPDNLNEFKALFVEGGKDIGEETGEAAGEGFKIKFGEQANDPENLKVTPEQLRTAEEEGAKLGEAHGAGFWSKAKVWLLEFQMNLNKLAFPGTDNSRIERALAAAREEAGIPEPFIQGQPPQDIFGGPKPDVLRTQVGDLAAAKLRAHELINSGGNYDPRLHEIINAQEPLTPEELARIQLIARENNLLGPEFLARGSSFVRGGLSVVGEEGPEIVGQRGPELVNLKRGSFVFNNKDTNVIAQAAHAISAFGNLGGGLLRKGGGGLVRAGGGGSGRVTVGLGLGGGMLRPRGQGSGVHTIGALSKIGGGLIQSFAGGTTGGIDKEALLEFLFGNLDHELAGGTIEERRAAFEAAQAAGFTDPQNQASMTAMMTQAAEILDFIDRQVIRNPDKPPRINKILGERIFAALSMAFGGGGSGGRKKDRDLQRRLDSLVVPPSVPDEELTVEERIARQANEILDFIEGGITQPVEQTGRRRRKKRRGQSGTLGGPQVLSSAEELEKVMAHMAGHHTNRGGGLSTHNPIYSTLPPNAAWLAENGMLAINPRTGAGWYIDDQGFKRPIFGRTTNLSDEEIRAGFGAKPIPPSEFRFPTDAEFVSSKFNDRAMFVQGDPINLINKYGKDQFGNVLPAFKRALMSYNRANKIAKRFGFTAGKLPYAVSEFRDNRGRVKDVTVTRKPADMSDANVIKYHRAYDQYKQQIVFAMESSGATNARDATRRESPTDKLLREERERRRKRDLNQIPGLARGGDVRRGGAAIVGEEGPEILELPTGASVTPLTGGSRTGAVSKALPNVPMFKRPFSDVTELNDKIMKATKAKISAFIMAVDPDGANILAFKDWTRKDLAAHTVETVIPMALARGHRIQGLFSIWRRVNSGLGASGEFRMPGGALDGEFVGGPAPGKPPGGRPSPGGPITNRGGFTEGFRGGGSRRRPGPGGPVGGPRPGGGFNPEPFQGFNSMAVEGSGGGTGTGPQGDQAKLNVAKAMVNTMTMPQMELLLKLMGEESALGADDWNEATLKEHINTVIIPNSKLPARAIFQYVTRAKKPIKKPKELPKRLKLPSGPLLRQVSSNSVSAGDVTSGTSTTSGTGVDDAITPAGEVGAGRSGVTQNFNVGNIRTDEDLERLAVVAGEKSRRASRRLG